MPLYKIQWPEDPPGNTKWGYHTDWVIRAESSDAALEIAGRDRDQINYIPDTTDLTCTEVPIDGPSEIILWYGPDA